MYSCGSKLAKISRAKADGLIAPEGSSVECNKGEHSTDHRGLRPDHVRTEGTWELERANKPPCRETGIGKPEYKSGQTAPRCYELDPE